MHIDKDVLIETLSEARRQLLASRAAGGYWTGYLSSSALSTATAVFALASADPRAYESLVRGGLDWLADNANTDGGWGDTVVSESNISTTALCWSAFSVAESASEKYRRSVAAAEGWLTRAAGGLEPKQIAESIIAAYGKDRTFSAPILSMCALAGRLGPSPAAWRGVPQLPFELAALPHRLLKWLRLPVVSYALPALIAIGQVRHHKCPTRNPVARVLRWLTRRGTLRELSNIQPEGGGFLEAAPLTSFVIMSLAAVGEAGSGVVSRGVAFLAESVRDDGSWPIDTNLAIWVTTLSVNALAANPDFHELLPDAARRGVREWLLGQQYRREHPYTHAAPGGWAWTDCPGGVPDADDTAGALLALRGLGPTGARTSEAAKAGVVWLMDLQNRDGGMPTFCRGWGTLPFDRSGADLTAHALLAIARWLDDLPPALNRRARGAIERGIEYLRNGQRGGGSWVPLWFGNQSAPGLENPTYGTARVVAALAGLATRGFAVAQEMSAKGAAWLVSAQNSDGGWGGAPSVASSVEETALAVDALACFRAGQGDGSSPASDLPLSAGDLDAAIFRGASWLVEHTDRGKRWHPSPIGFYFARLWYFERLYPLIFTVSALERVRSLMLTEI